ncbi:MAG: hypothetical protein WB586_29110 [Chthoniobacterales bacterium]
MLTATLIPKLEDQAYICHPGTQGGTSCTFELVCPPRAKCIPYAHLLAIDVLGDRLFAIRYSFADVELSIGRDFAGKRQFLDDLANFRVATVREGKHLRISIAVEQNSEKTEKF